MLHVVVVVVVLGGRGGDTRRPAVEEGDAISGGCGFLRAGRAKG